MGGPKWVVCPDNWCWLFFKSKAIDFARLRLSGSPSAADAAGRFLLRSSYTQLSITVNDPVTHKHLYVASGSPVALPPNGIQIMLAVSGASSGTGVTLSIASGNGITGTDGTPFAGISGVRLPFGR